MSLDHVMKNAFDLMEKSLVERQKTAAFESSRLEKMVMEQERTKRMGFSSQERIQNLINQGLLDGQELVNQGLLNQEQLKESGLMDRQKNQFQHERSIPVFKEFKNKGIDEYGIETETTTWKNVNTPEERLRSLDGGTATPDDLNFLSGSSKAPSKIDASKVEKLSDSQQGTGFVRRLDTGRQVDTIGGRIYDRGEEVPMPSRTHQLTPGTPTGPSPIDAGQSIIPRVLESAHTPGQYNNNYVRSLQETQKQAQPTIDPDRRTPMMRTMAESQTQRGSYVQPLPDDHKPFPGFKRRSLPDDYKKQPLWRGLL